MVEDIFFPDNENKWFNSPVFGFKGPLNEIKNVIPLFERHPFGIGSLGERQSRVNDRLDLIVRQPYGSDQHIIPIGTVSKDYTLVQHTEVIELASKAFEKVHIDLSSCHTEMVLTEYGERMNLSIYLPKKYRFNPGDGHEIDLRLECYNSVDGSSKFRALLGWFRYICSNGLIVGITESDIRKRHYKEMFLMDVETDLLTTLNKVSLEKDNFIKWRQYSISPDSLNSWIINTLWKKWGFKAATRAFHIARTGNDVNIYGSYKGNSPLTIPVQKINSVPGAPERCSNLFDLSQVLAWLAKERRDIQEQLEWKEAIPDLLDPFMN